MSPRKRSPKPRVVASTQAPQASGAEDTQPEAAASEGVDSAEDSERAAREVSSVDEIKGVHDAPEASAGASDAESDSDDPQQRGSLPPDPAGPPATREHLKRVIESLVFASEQIITAQQLGRITKTKVAEIRELMPEIIREWEGRGVELVEVASGYQFRSCAASAPFVRDLVAQRPVRLTRAQLETLALVAYRQPITRPEIDDVRGVDSGSALKVLLERGLLKILGRKDEAGRPLLYGSTPYFLEFFGMKSMSDLPTLREFTELTDEHRELFKRKTGEVPEDLGSEQVNVVSSATDAETEETIDDDELMAIAEAAKAEADEQGRAVVEAPAVADDQDA
jgi:segregation and condensation protein B